MGAARKHDVFDGLADPTRREILAILSKDRKNIKELTQQFSITRTAIAKHLKLLKDVQLITVETQGRAKVYQFNPHALKEVKDLIAYFDQFWDNKLANLSRLINETNEREQE